VAVNRPQDFRDFLCRKALDLEKPRDQVMNQNVLRAIHIFGRVGGLLCRHTLPPTLPVTRDRLDEQDLGEPERGEDADQVRHRCQRDAGRRDACRPGFFS